MQFKRFNITLYEIGALCIIAFAVVLRIALISQRWPATNSDEGTIGLMALHIAYRHAHPIFFYGQGYMGALEAYLAAPLFRLFGPSLFVLRMGLIILLTLFFISTYWLTSLLYNKKLALLTLLFLSLGCVGELTTQLRAIGGYAETLLFAALLLLLATLLAYSYRGSPSRKRRVFRYLLYSCWGCVVGLGIWTDLLILPIVIMSGLFLLIVCWPDLDSLAPSCIIASFMLGILPSLLYNFRALPENGTLAYFLLDYRADPITGLPIQHAPLFKQVLGSLLLGLPEAAGVGSPCTTHFRLLSELLRPAGLPCTFLLASWSAGALLLWLSAVMLSLLALWKHRREVKQHFIDAEARYITVRYCARLMLLGCSALTFILFALSPSATLDPLGHSRYLICLLIATPALLAPLCEDGYGVGVIFLYLRATRRAAAGREASPALPGAARGRRLAIEICTSSILLCICTLLVLGTLATFNDLPSTQAWNRSQDGLIAHLLRMGATRIYSDYWTCDRIIFASDERIICSVIGDDTLSGYNRYLPYYLSVRADNAHTSYVLPLRTPVALNFARKISHFHISRRFRRYIFDGYVIYQPT